MVFFFPDADALVLITAHYNILLKNCAHTHDLWGNDDRAKMVSAKATKSQQYMHLQVLKTLEGYLV